MEISAYMPKHSLQKLWQKANKDKVNRYQTKYFEDKVRVTLVLNRDFTERVARMKLPDESYASRIKRTIEEWLEEHDY